jgi:SET family sugar efflux transporter-like MFS transporter
MNIATWKRVYHARNGKQLGLCILLQGILTGIILPLLPLILSNQIGMDKLGITVFYLIYTVIGVGVMLGTGHLSDGKLARHKLVFICGILGTLGYFSLAGTVQRVFAYIGGILSIGGNVLFPQLFAVAQAGVMAQWNNDAQIAGTMVLRTMFSLGFIAGTGLASAMTHIMAIQTVFLMIAIARALLTLYATLVLYQIENGAQASHSTCSATSQPELQNVFMRVTVLILPLLSLIRLFGADSTRNVYLPLVMFQTFNDASIAPIMFGITAAIELVTLGLVGGLSSKTGEKAVISLCTLLGGLYFLVVSISQWLPLLYAIH